MTLEDALKAHSAGKYKSGITYKDRSLEGVIKSTANSVGSFFSRNYNSFMRSSVGKTIEKSKIYKPFEWLGSKYLKSLAGLLPAEVQYNMLRKRGKKTAWELGEYTRWSLFKGSIEHVFDWMGSSALIAVPYVGFLGYAWRAYTIMGSFEIASRTAIHLYTKKPIGLTSMRLGWETYKSSKRWIRNVTNHKPILGDYRYTAFSGPSYAPAYARVT
jgi:hypothetical protein